MAKERHSTVNILDEAGAQQAVNNPRFKGLTAISSTHYEVSFRKKSVNLNLPLQIGLFVYGYAKLRLLQFYYDFLAFYVHKRDFQIITCDTDSMYAALSAPSLEEIVKPTLRSHFEQNKHKWLPATQCAEHKTIASLSAGASTFTNPTTPPSPPPPCCASTYQHEKREPGLWKVEAVADRIVALSPKCYICSNHDTQERDKVSCKGVQKRINPLSYAIFRNVLETQQPHYVINRGFRLDSKQNMRTFVQPKTGMSYLYVK
ncbi:MAG: hypothetical protein SV429_13420, partial [Pseudomonadota bacterium]|nr:hypothetical protein [Pseudomonadota bacterium]